MARSTPASVQSPATLRGDGTIALGTTPTVGNLMVMLTSGFHGSLDSYAPAGMFRFARYNSDANNGVQAWARRVQSGDTGSYSLSASDNQSACLYEFSGAAGIYPIAGGAMSSLFSGANFSIWTPDSPFGVNDLVLGAFGSDTTATWSITGETGLTVDYQTTGAVNHTGAYCTINPATHDGVMAGSTSSAPTAPVFELLAVVGTP